MNQKDNQQQAVVHGSFTGNLSTDDHLLEEQRHRNYPKRNSLPNVENESGIPTITNTNENEASCHRSHFDSDKTNLPNNVSQSCATGEADSSGSENSVTAMSSCLRQRARNETVKHVQFAKPLKVTYEDRPIEPGDRMKKYRHYNKNRSRIIRKVTSSEGRTKIDGANAIRNAMELSMDPDVDTIGTDLLEWPHIETDEAVLTFLPRGYIKAVNGGQDYSINEGCPHRIERRSRKRHRIFLFFVLYCKAL